MKYLYLILILLSATPKLQAATPILFQIESYGKQLPPIEPARKTKPSPKKPAADYGKLAGWFFVLAMALNFVAGAFTIVAIANGFFLLVLLWIAAQLLTAFLAWFFLIRTKMMQDDRKGAAQVVLTCLMVLGLSLAIGGLVANSLWFGLAGLACLILFCIFFFPLLLVPPPPRNAPEPYVNDQHK